MLLTVDIGNTNITLGLFNSDNNFETELRLPSDRDLSCVEYEVLLKSLLKDFKISDCICASVVEELNDKLKQALCVILGFEPEFIGINSNLGIKVVSDNPSEVGADRLANAVAVCGKYKNRAVIVVDFGTATTFDIVNSKGEFCGGIIAPGLKTQLKCLNSSTSKLPKIEVSISPKALGANTQEAILSGVIRGSACMVDGMVEQCEHELGESAILVGTGGYCGLIQSYTKRKFDEVNPILTLEGLCRVYLNNKSLNNCYTNNKN